ncbi:MAG: glutamate 5-kinase [Bacteroidota bacterium]
MATGKSDKKKLLLKIGTATLTRGGDNISRGKIEDIAGQIKQLKADYDFIIVCSGAIAAARQFIQLENFGKDIKEKQALAAIGQPFLMRLLQESFRECSLPVAQCLLSYSDFIPEVSKQNIRNTINVLLQNGVVPIINENDTVATDEIKFGDNDKLSALTATLIDADLLVLASNTFGLYDDQEQTIPLVEDITQVRKYVKSQFSSQGTGGMQSKLDAAAIAQQHGIETWLVNGHEDGFLRKALRAETRFTKVGGC